MKKTLCAVLLAVFTVSLLSASPAQALSGNGIIIGDSISVMSSPYFLRTYHPSFDVDAENGRRLNTLPEHINARLAAGPAPKVMVLALASNDSPEFTRQQYVDAFDSIPSTTKVVMVTPYRDPAIFPEQQTRLAEINGWMKDLDKYRPNGVISSWRWTMLNEPDAVAKYISDDGVHPTAAGRRKWGELLDKAIG